MCCVPVVAVSKKEQDIQGGAA